MQTGPLPYRGPILIPQGTPRLGTFALAERNATHQKTTQPAMEICSTPLLTFVDDIILTVALHVRSCGWQQVELIRLLMGSSSVWQVLSRDEVFDVTTLIRGGLLSHSPGSCNCSWICLAYHPSTPSLPTGCHCRASPRRT